jgi:cyclohexa-1,5-dienecarbonyl-CoA hydratase
MSTVPKSKHARIALDIVPPVARVTLTHPPLNVIDLRMMDELLAALEQLQQRDDISITTLSGSETTFSAGVDVAAHAPDQVVAMLGKFHSVIRALIAARKVTVASVRGNCLGGGAELALVCDMVYTTASANWGFPEIKLACFPPVAAVALSAAVGQKRAADLILSGRTISGDEAKQIGLANDAVADSDLDRAVDQAVARLAELSPAALAVTKKALYSWDAIHFDKGMLRSEKIYLDELMQTADAHEGINAFLEKRKPVWKGK